jgi:hypothetical protein
MVLLDNYLVMHGRCPFEGTRLHAVSWFKSQMLSPCSIHAQSMLSPFGWLLACHMLVGEDLT